MQSRILIVDDEPDIRQLIRYNLEQAGYYCAEAEHGKQALEMMEKTVPDLVLMDIMMPEMDGITTCNQIRQHTAYDKTYVVFLTARAEEYSELAGFEAGADDYITKPIKPRVLLSRIKAILKRDRSAAERKDELRVGGLVINREAYTVVKEGKELILPKKEFELLFLLASKPNKVFSREMILSEVWGNEVYVVDRTIDVHIRKIREKIGDHMIRTIKGVGYKFEV